MKTKLCPLSAEAILSQFICHCSYKCEGREEWGGGGRRGGLKLFIFFKNVILSGLCPVVRQDCKLQTLHTPAQEYNKNHKQIYLNIKHTARGKWMNSRTFIFSQIFLIYWSQNENEPIKILTRESRRFQF